MDLSLADAARLLGKSQRQVRYLIAQGRLEARKDGGRWVVPRDKLPLAPAAVSRGIEEQARLREVIETALGTAGPAATQKRRYSVSDLRAFQAGRRILAAAGERHGAESPVARRLTESLALIACGCHSFHRRDKVGYLVRAREHVCYALSALLVAAGASAEGEPEPLATAIETELLPALGGMLRSAERRR